MNAIDIEPKLEVASVRIGGMSSAGPSVVSARLRAVSQVLEEVELGHDARRAGRPASR